MNSLRPLLKLWLKLECQMVTHCSAGLLVQLSEDDKHTVMASWPEKHTIDKAMVHAASTVMSKKRIHMQKPEHEEGGYLYFGHPIVIDDKFWGAIVLHIRKPSSRDMQAVVKILQWGMTWLRFLLYQNEIETTGKALGNTRESGQMISFLATALKEKSTEETAIAVVNFIASQFQFDRVCLGLTRANKINLVAVSFSASFDERTQPMQNIVNAMEEAVSQRRDIQLEEGDETPSPGYIVRSHQALLESHRVKHLSTWLIRKDDQVLGAVTVEQARVNRITESVQDYLHKSLTLIASVLDLKLQAQLGLKQKFRHKSMDFLHRVFGASHPVEKFIAAAVTGLILIMFVPADYRVVGDAALQSSNKHLVVSPHDGFIGRVHVKPGDSVTESQLLVTLKDEELNLERRRISSELQQYQLEYDNALASGDRAQAAILAARVEQGKAKLKLVEKKLERTRLGSPIDGVIISDDITQSQGAPTTQGEVLFEIADSENFYVQLFINEKDIAELQTGQIGKLNLASLPGESFEFVIERITPLSELKDGNNYFKLEAKITSPSDLLRPGMTGNGKILIDERALGWIWFHEIWNWLRLKLWF